MNSWSDTGIVLSSKNHLEKYKIIDIFTKNHGKVSGIISSSKSSNLSIFSNVFIDYSSKNINSLGFWKIREQKQNWVYLMHSQINILVFQSICYLLIKTLPYNLTYKKLFDFIYKISNDLFLFKDDIEIINIYAYFEFLLLNEIGFGIDLNHCSICESKKNIIYLIKKDYFGISECCFQKYSKENLSLIKVPEIWNIWNIFQDKTDIHISQSMIEDIKNSLRITNEMLNIHISYLKNPFQEFLINKLTEFFYNK